MRIYTVFEHGDGASDPTDPGNGVIFVKEGFCWPALFFPIIWMLYHRMWLVTGGYLLVSFAVTAAGQALLAEPAYGQFVILGFSLLVAYEANELRRWHLREKGFVHRATIAAENLPQAEQRYFGTRGPAAVSSDCGATESTAEPTAEPTGGRPTNDAADNGADKGTAYPVSTGIMPAVAAIRPPSPRSGSSAWGFSLPEGRR